MPIPRRLRGQLARHRPDPGEACVDRGTRRGSRASYAGADARSSPRPAHVDRELDESLRAGRGDIVVELLQAGAEHGGGPLPRRPRGPRPGSTAGPTRSWPPARGQPTDAASDDGDARLLLRPDRAPRREPARATPCPTWSGRGRRRRRRAAQRPRLRLRDGDRRQRHHDGRAAAAPSSCSPSTPTSGPLVADPTLVRTLSRSSSGSPRRCRDWPHRDPRRGAARRHDPGRRKVLLCYGAANRDPRRSARTRTARRAPAARASSSPSARAARLLGNAAARMIARVALRSCWRGSRRSRVDVDGVTWAPGPYVRRPLSAGRRMTCTPRRSSSPRCAPPPNSAAGTPE